MLVQVSEQFLDLERTFQVLCRAVFAPEEVEDRLDTFERRMREYDAHVQRLCHIGEWAVIASGPEHRLSQEGIRQCVETVRERFPLYT